MTRAKRNLLIAAGAVVAVIAGVLVWPREREPVYQGKTLSAWAKVYDEDHPAPSDVKRADAALQQIGTNGVPCVINWLLYERPPWKDKLCSGMGSLPPMLHFKFLDETVSRDAKFDRAEGAPELLSRLKPDPKFCIPELTRIMTDSNLPFASGRAISALAGFGKDALPSLLAAMANPQQAGRAHIAGVIPEIHDLGTNSRAVVIAMISSLKDRDTWLAATAAESLGELKIEPDVAVPALVEGLGASDYWTRGACALALAKFRTRAGLAVPALLRALDDPDDSARSAATMALAEIAPAELEHDKQTRKHSPPRIFHPID